MMYSVASLPESISNAIFMTFPFFVSIAAFTYAQEMMTKI
jgi:drug/metabolite transporter (DMT)-like permease